MNIYEKLTALQNELAVPKGRNNSFGKYRYRSAEDILEKVKPLLLKHRLNQTITDEIIVVDGWYYVKATITVTDMDKPEDKIVVSANAREEETKKGMDSAQVTGSTSSYARKYALNGMYGIDESEADPDYLSDGNGTKKGDKLAENGNKSVISKEQVIEIYALAAKKGFPSETVDKQCMTKFKKPTANEIDADMYAIMKAGYSKLKDVDEFEGTPFGR